MGKASLGGGGGGGQPWDLAVWTLTTGRENLAV